MISHFTYRLRIFFAIILVGVLGANLSEELKEKEIQESSEKVEYVYSQRGSFELEKTFTKSSAEVSPLDYKNIKAGYAFSIINNRLFIKFCQLIHYN